MILVNYCENILKGCLDYQICKFEKNMKLISDWMVCGITLLAIGLSFSSVLGQSKEAFTNYVMQVGGGELTLGMEL